MIATLADAWQWYESVQKLTRTMQQLGTKHWASLPWEGALGRDNWLRHLEDREIIERSDRVFDDLDDLCILLLFSVFEARLRERVLVDVARELPTVQHAALKQAIDTLNDTIEHGSVYKVLEPFKSVLGADVVEQVHQVRKYRNWVAHGRRGAPENAVSPQAAYTRLQRFLERLVESTVRRPPTGPAHS